MTGSGQPNLTALRLNRGLSQAGAAREAEVSKSAWSRAEEGESVSPANAHKIAAFFDLKVTDIWPLDDTEAAAA